MKLKCRMPLSAEYEKKAKMLLAFTNVMAVFFAALCFLQVVIGFLGFESKVIDEETGEMSRFLDIEQYQNYLFLSAFLGLIFLISVIFPRLSGIPALLSACFTGFALYFFANGSRLPEWNFAINSILMRENTVTLLFVGILLFAGYSATAVMQDLDRGSKSYYYIFLGFSVFTGLLAIYFALRSGAMEKIIEANPDISQKEDGYIALRLFQLRSKLWMVAQYERERLYIVMGLMQLLAATFAFFWREYRFLVGCASFAPVVYYLIRFSSDELDFFPLGFGVMILSIFLATHLYLTFYPRPLPEADAEEEESEAEPEKINSKGEATE